MASKVQSVRFDRRRWTIPAALQWLHGHHFRPLKTPDITPNQYRFRIIAPSQFDHFSTVVTEKGIELIIGFPAAYRAAAGVTGAGWAIG